MATKKGLWDFGHLAIRHWKYAWSCLITQLASKPLPTSAFSTASTKVSWSQDYLESSGFRLSCICKGLKQLGQQFHNNIWAVSWVLEALSWSSPAIFSWTIDHWEATKRHPKTEKPSKSSCQRYTKRKMIQVLDLKRSKKWSDLKKVSRTCPKMAVPAKGCDLVWAHLAQRKGNNIKPVRYWYGRSWDL